MASPPQGAHVLTRLADLVLRHRALVAVFWLVVLVGGLAGSSTATEWLTFDFSLPGSTAIPAQRPQPAAQSAEEPARRP